MLRLPLLQEVAGFLNIYNLSLDLLDMLYLVNVHNSVSPIIL
jgi:hypothetical protein